MVAWRGPLLLVGLLPLVLSGVAAAAEIDSLTGRSEPLRDSRPRLEAWLDVALHEGIERANRASDTRDPNRAWGRVGACDERVLYREVRRALAAPFIGHAIAERLNEDPALEKRHVHRAESIYRDLGLLDNVSVHLKDLSSVVRVGDAIIGVDKLGHFVVEGWEYFETAQLEGEGVEAAMSWGESTERTYFGRYTTGVYSHADLVANFEGLRFWLRLAGAGNDPLATEGGGDRPLIRCGRRFWLFGERRWKLARGVDLRRHVSPVWDEAVNCSSYRSPEIEALVARRVEELSAADGVDYTCPVAPAACAAARERYGPLAVRLLHPRCLAAEAPPARPWWRLW